MNSFTKLPCTFHVLQQNNPLRIRTHNTRRSIKKTCSQFFFGKRSSSSAKAKKQEKCDPCEKPKKKTLFQRIIQYEFKFPRPKDKSYEKKLKECREDVCSPDFSGVAPENQIFRTEGVAALIYRESKIPAEPEPTKEQKILQKIEANLDEKNIPDFVPHLPPFRSVCERMMELDKRRLHPAYLKYMRKPPQRLRNLIEQTGKNKSRPTYGEDIPILLKCNKDLLEKKNLYIEYKRVMPPGGLDTKLIEFQKNARYTLEQIQKHWKDKKPNPCSLSDTLYQERAKL